MRLRDGNFSPQEIIPKKQVRQKDRPLVRSTKSTWRETNLVGLQEGAHYESTRVGCITGELCQREDGFQGGHSVYM